MVMSKPVVGWFEITRKEGPALQHFYSGLFGWEVTDASQGYGLVAPTEIPDFGLTFASVADPERHAVGLSKGAVR
jgi:hypothetical protein